MRTGAFALVIFCLASAPAWAQDANTDDSDAVSDETTAAPVQTMAQLLEKGFEIKAAAPSGNAKLIIFMQNEKSAYACEFTNLANTRCGSVN